MNCAGLERWLDAGMPAGDAGAAKSHAVSCPACARGWEAQRSLESLLSEGPAPAPPLLTQQVMAKVAAERRGLGWTVGDREVADIPWWVRLFAEPSTALAVVIASILLAWGGRLWALGSAILAGFERIGMPPWIPILSRDWLGFHSLPAVFIGTVIIATIAVLSLGLYRGVVRMIST
jgi:hypothetical protein